MKKLVLFWVLAGSLFVFCAVKACMEYLDAEELRVVFFSPELGANSSMNNFYYNPRLLGNDFNGPEKDIDTNVSEWRTWTGKNIPRADIDSIIYGRCGLKLTSYYSSLLAGKKIKKDSLYVKNKFIRHLSDKKENWPVLEYIIYAKEVEFAKFYYPGMWENPNQDSQQTLQHAAIKIGLGRYSTCKSEFLKLRYGFLVERLAAYAGSADSTELFYKKFVMHSPVNSVIKLWGLDYYAYSLPASRRSEAAYYLSLIYDKCPGKKLKAFKYFEKFTRRGLSDTTLNLCRNAHEKALVYGMKGMACYDIPGLEYLKKAVELDPGASDMFEVILIREVNKAENDIMTPMITSYPDKYGPGTDYVISDVHSMYEDDNPENINLKQLISFASTYAQTIDVRNPALWNLAASYLSMLDRQYTDAHKYSELAASRITDKLKSELHLVNILIALNEKPAMDDALERNIYADIKWFESDTSNDRRNVYNVFRLMGQKYIAQKDFGKALLCFGRYGLLNQVKDTRGSEYFYPDFFSSTMKEDFDYIMDYIATADDLAKMSNFMDKASKNRFEELLAGTSTTSRSTLYHEIGMHYMRDMDFNAAKKYFILARDTFQYHYTGDAFSSKDACSLDSGQMETKYYLRIEFKPAVFAEKMLELESLFTKDPANKAKYYYQYANGLYNLTYWGNSWNYIRHYRTYSGPYVFAESNKHNGAYPFEKNYFLCSRAMEYYQKAWNSAPNAEFAAECVFQLAKCSQKQHFVSDEAYRYIDSKAEWYNPYFEIMKKRYRKTKYYALAATDCSVFKDYLH